LLGADRVISIDSIAIRLAKAKSAGAETLNYQEVDVLAKLKEMTGGRGPDSCLDAVGLEAHGTSLDAVYDRAKSAVGIETDRTHVLRQAIQACRKGGTVSIPGVYAGFVDKFPLGVAFAKGLTLKMGQTHVQRLTKPLLDLIEKGAIDPSFIITHRVKLADGPAAYQTFKKREDDCVKVVMTP